MNYDKIINEVGRYVYRPKKICKFRNQIDEECRLYELYYYKRHWVYDENKNRKFYNHLKLQGKFYTHLDKVHKKYKCNTFYHYKGKGLFEFRISYVLGEREYIYYQITRNSITLNVKEVSINLETCTDDDIFNLIIQYPDLYVPDVNKLKVMQEILKHKPSGTYYITI